MNWSTGDEVAFIRTIGRWATPVPRPSRVELLRGYLKGLALRAPSLTPFNVGVARDVALAELQALGAKA